MGGGLATLLGALHPDRVDGLVTIAGAHPWSVSHPEREQLYETMFEPTTDPQGWEKYNVHYWRENWEDFAEFFLAEAFSDPHSTKLWDDSVGWALETNGEVIALASESGPTLDLAAVEAGVAEMTMPVLIIHGTGDRIQPSESSAVLHERIPHAELVMLEGAGHLPNGRYPVKINNLIKDFSDTVYGRTPESIPRRTDASRPKKALMLSSSIGLGHARRDVAICDELRLLHPDLEIEWLAQDPVTRSCKRQVRSSTQHRASWPAKPITSSQKQANTTWPPSRHCATWTRSWSRTS